jgi:hypothetical protein
VKQDAHQRNRKYKKVELLVIKKSMTEIKVQHRASTAD